MQTDKQGQKIGTDSISAIAALDKFRDSFLGWRADTPVHAHNAHDADPDCVYTNTILGIANLSLERLDAPMRAAPYLEAARSNIGRATEYERMFLDAAEAWARGDGVETITGFEAIGERYPSDLVSVKIAQFHHFMRGNSYGLLRCSNRAADACPDDPFALGLVSFGYVECNRFEEAEESARKAIDGMRNEVWAHHNLAHVMEMQGRFEEGADWLSGFTDTWGDCNREFRSHMAWHHSLYCTAMGDTDKALDLFDNKIWGPDTEWGNDKDLTRFPLHAVGLLWRLSLEGVDVGDRWKTVANQITARAPEPVEPFPTLLYLYAFAKSGRLELANTLLEAIVNRARSCDPYAHRAWNEVARPAALGLVAHAKGDYDGAWRHLAPVSHAWLALGGSRAQQSIFQRTWLDTLLRSSHSDQAFEQLRIHAYSNATDPSAWRSYASACKRVGRVVDEREALAKAEELEVGYRLARK